MKVSRIAVVAVAGCTLALVAMLLVGWKLYSSLAHDYSQSSLLAVATYQQIIFGLSFLVIALIRFKLHVRCPTWAILCSVFLVVGYGLFCCVREDLVAGLEMLFVAATLLSLGRSMLVALWLHILARLLGQRAILPLIMAWALSSFLLLFETALPADSCTYSVVLVIAVGLSIGLTLWVVMRKHEELDNDLPRESFWLRAQDVAQSEEGSLPAVNVDGAPYRYLKLFSDLGFFAAFMALLDFFSTIIFFFLMPDPANPYSPSDTSPLQSVSKFIAACLVLFFWKEVASQKNLSRVAQILYLIAITCGLFLPFFGESAFPVVGTMTATTTACASIMVMIVGIKESLARHLDPLVVCSFFVGVFYLGMGAGYGVGFVAYLYSASDSGSIFYVVSLLSVYALSISLFTFSRIVANRNEKRLIAKQAIHAETAVDRVVESCAILSEQHGLSAREAEVLSYLAQGRDAAYISEKLYISENTVRSHVKSIYRKVGLHNRQELFDLVNRPSQ